MSEGGSDDRAQGTLSYISWRSKSLRNFVKFFSGNDRIRNFGVPGGRVVALEILSPETEEDAGIESKWREAENAFSGADAAH